MWGRSQLCSNSVKLKSASHRAIPLSEGVGLARQAAQAVARHPVEPLDVDRVGLIDRGADCRPFSCPLLTVSAAPQRAHAGL
jgi:hypothetical protein